MSRKVPGRRTLLLIVEFVASCCARDCADCNAELTLEFPLEGLLVDDLERRVPELEAVTLRTPSAPASSCLSLGSLDVTQC